MQLDILYNEDCLVGMRRLPDNSVDLIATDPPYFRVKGEAWDRQWEDSTKFIGWIGELCQEWQRILKPNGGLYCFASPQMAARVEVKISETFNVLNAITWAKPDPFSSINRGASNSGRISKESLRSYYPNTERIIFAEHYGADNIAKGEAGYAAKCDELRGFIFEPLRRYLEDECDRAKADRGITRREINLALGCTETSGGMLKHYTRAVQWVLPTPEHYETMRVLLNNGGGDYLQRPYEELRQQYEELRQQYEELRQQYEELRRPFAVSPFVPFTDVWTFPTVQSYRGKHPCEKPIAMMEHIIAASSNPEAVVLDCFMGSGTMAVACQNTGRHYIGFEKDPKYFEIAQKRIANHQPQLSLTA
jgi:adenine-specific DNA-methyltransferase